MPLLGPDIRITENQHRVLLDYLEARYKSGFQFRNTYKSRWNAIDREVNSYLKLNAEDSERKRKNDRGEGVRPIESKASLIFTRMQEAVTYVHGVLAPDVELYSAVAAKEHKQAAKSFSLKMNRDAQIFGHHRQLMLLIFDSLKYNFAPLLTDYEVRTGLTVANQPSTQGTDVAVPPKVEQGVIWQGNRLLAIDPLNFTFDCTLEDLTALPRDGEFAGYVHQTTDFRLRQLFAQGRAFDWDNIAKKTRALQGDVSARYFENHPQILSPHLAAGSAASGYAPTMDWVTFFASAQNRSAPGEEHIAARHEVINLWIHLPPYPFRLVKDRNRSEYELWHFRILNGERVVFAAPVPQTHGMLPFSLAHSLYDRSIQTQTFAERLSPLQDLQSFELNSHVHETRNGVNGGMLFFDEQVFPQLKEQNEDVRGGGRFGGQSLASNDNIANKVFQITSQPQIADVAANVQLMDALAEEALPSQMARQVAGLDRATQFQAAAVVAAASRRMLTIAMLIDTTALTPSRHMQHHNLLVLGPPQQLITPEGELVDANPAQWREAKLEFTLSSGLRGMDRLTFIFHIKEVLNAILQNQNAAASFDVPAIINYWTQLIGDYTDFTQFKIQSPIDALPPEQRNAAYELLLQAQQGTTPQQ